MVAVTAAALVGDWRPWEDADPARTEIRLFASGAGSGLPTGLTITRTVSGSCNYESNVDPVPEARRCASTESFLYDPCFGYATELICVGSPWSTTATRFRVRKYTFFLKNNRIVDWDPAGTEPMPVEPRLPADVTKTEPPWAVELVNGQRCVLVSGATFVVAGQRGNYQCSRADGFNGGRGSWLIGVPDRTTQPWLVSYLAPRTSQTTQVAVKVAWY